VHILLYTIRWYLIDSADLVVLIVRGLRKTPGRLNIKKYANKKSPVNKLLNRKINTQPA